MAYNTVYSLVDTEPVAKYVKTIGSALTAWRLDKDGKNEIECMLTGDDPEVDYEASVLELYTTREVAYFTRKNRVLFERGWIKPFDGAPSPVNAANYMTDAAVEEVASLRKLADLEPRLEGIDSAATLARILMLAEERGMPKRLRDAIEARLVMVKSG
jgi:hypothetical protein